MNQKLKNGGSESYSQPSQLSAPRTHFRTSTISRKENLRTEESTEIYRPISTSHRKSLSKVTLIESRLLPPSAVELNASSQTNKYRNNQSGVLEKESFNLYSEKKPTMETNSSKAVFKNNFGAIYNPRESSRSPYKPLFEIHKHKSAASISAPKRIFQSPSERVPSRNEPRRVEDTSIRGSNPIVQPYSQTQSNSNLKYEQ